MATFGNCPTPSANFPDPPGRSQRSAAAGDLFSPRLSDGAAGPGEGRVAKWRLVVCVFLPFAAGYYLSYLFRTINALISGPLQSEQGLEAADLGFLTLSGDVEN